MTDPHTHTWDWLAEVRYVLDARGQIDHAANVQCTDCAETAWAHGHGPTNPARSEPDTPTTKGATHARH